MTKRLVVQIIIAGIAAIAGVYAQDYPVKPVRIVVSGVGGGSDFTARLISPGVSAGLGQPVVVDNRASGFVPGQTVSQSVPDGYTLLLYGATLYLETLLRAKAPYDPIKDFSAVVLIAREPSVLVVHPSLPAKSVKELIALTTARPGELNYGSGGTGSTAHLMAELFKSMTGVNIVRVPYKVTGQQLIDVVSGHIQMTFIGASAAAPHLKSGRLRALAITSAQPSPLFPGMPTVAATVPGYELISMSGVWAPAKTPDAIVKRLNQEIVRVLGQPEIRQKLATAGQDIVAGSPEEFAAWLKTDIARMSRVIKDAGIVADN